MICPAIDNPASCESRVVILFLHAKTAEIHCELCAAVYGQNVTNEGIVRQWCRKFKDGGANVHYKERSGRLFSANDYLIKSVNPKICERRSFTISELLCEFSQISRTVLYEIITVRLGYQKFCARWVLKILTVAHKSQRMASAFVDLFTEILKR
jgi:hypothetical protein